MIKIIVTGFSCEKNAVVTDRFWKVDTNNNTFQHLGTKDLNFGVDELLIKALGAELVIMRIPDDAFKALLLALDYKQAT